MNPSWLKNHDVRSFRFIPLLNTVCRAVFDVDRKLFQLFFYAENPFFRFLINVKLLELQSEWRMRWMNEVIHSLSTLLQIVVMLYISDLNTQKFGSDISVFRARTVQPKRVQHQLSSQSLSPRRRKKLKKKKRKRKRKRRRRKNLNKPRTI